MPAYQKRFNPEFPDRLVPATLSPELLQNLLPISPKKHHRVLFEIMGGCASEQRVAEHFIRRMEEAGFEMIPYEKEVFDFSKPMKVEGVRDFRSKYDLVIYIGNVENASNKTTSRLNWHAPYGMGNNIPWFVDVVPTLFISLQNPYHLLADFGEELDGLKERIGFRTEEQEEFRQTAELLYLPLDEETGMIPQFDGYFDLSRELEVQGGSKSGYTQMKQAGLYHKSQVIKQPDVLMLFAYQNLETPETIYRRNLDYYQARCEAASSLSYCVHSICYADLGMPESAYGYLMETAEMDLKDAHGGTKDGVHSGCAAGAWMAVVRGVAGMKMTSEEVRFMPHFIPWWKQVTFHCVWHGQGYCVVLDNQKMQVLADDTNQGVLQLSIYEKSLALKAGERMVYELTIPEV